MSRVGSAIDRARARVDRVASRALPDLCDIVQIRKVSDGFSGHTEGETSVATNIPVEVTQAPASGNTVIAGDVTYIGTHRLKFGWNATTVAINPKQIIKVQARGNESMLRFEQPIRERGSNSEWLFVLAKLTTGYRSPSNV
ncbi:MAG TPA: hypothetical protein VIX17_11405 [Pyrinomonadaceae bacterium]|jgi:hypothetical protein